MKYPTSWPTSCFPLWFFRFKPVSRDPWAYGEESQKSSPLQGKQRWFHLWGTLWKVAVNTQLPHGNGKNRPTRAGSHHRKPVPGGFQKSSWGSYVSCSWPLCVWQSARCFSIYYYFEINRLPNLLARRWFDESSFRERWLIYGWVHRRGPCGEAVFEAEGNRDTLMWERR